VHRFFVAPELLREDRMTLTGGQARQIATVLRLRVGDEIALVADGAEAVVALEAVRPTSVIAVVRERGFTPAEPSVVLTLALPVLRGDHDEEVVEAVAQLGASRIVPFTSARSVVRTLSEAKRSRWERIAREAAETARRGRVPSIEPVRAWTDLFAALPAPVFVAWEGERRARLRDAIPQATRALSLVIGPEGGIADDEIAALADAGANPVRLGPTVLRTSTAAAVALGALGVLTPRWA